MKDVACQLFWNTAIEKRVQGAEGAAEIGRGTREQAVKGRKRLQKSMCACDWGIAGCEADGATKRHTEEGGEGA